MVSRRVIGRVWWDQTHPSPWMTFKHVTAFREWSREIRKAQPGLKTEYAPLDQWTPEAMLSTVREEA